MIQSKFYNYWDKCHYLMLSGVLRGYLPNRLVDTGRKGFGPRHLLPFRAMFQWILPFHITARQPIVLRATTPQLNPKETCVGYQRFIRPEYRPVGYRIFVCLKPEPVLTSISHSFAVSSAVEPNDDAISEWPDE
jgi:hypothetical protein